MLIDSWPHNPTELSRVGHSQPPQANAPRAASGAGPLGHQRWILLACVILLLQSAAGCKPRNLPPTTPQMDTSPAYWVRVLLLGDVAECTVDISTGFAVALVGSNAPPTTFEKQPTPMKITLDTGALHIGNLPVRAFEIDLLPDPPHVVNVNGVNYRGQLRLIANSDGKTFDAINLVPLEPYLAGVVGAEMPEYWEPAALQAQAIAARTYCLYTKKRFGTPRTWDVSRTQATQVYRGLDGESERVWDAVRQTTGRVMTCRNEQGVEDYFPAYYSSNFGGHTEDSENVFGESFSALKGVACPYCKDVAQPRYFFWPAVRMDKATVAEILASRYPRIKELGDITEIKPIRTSKYADFSRITRVGIYGADGRSNWLRGEDFRLALDPSGRKLRSAAFEIRSEDDQWVFTGGRGWGHGVGLCQCGAQALARKGRSADEILLYYYRTAKIKKLYQ